MSDTPKPQNLLEALADIARLTQERDALRTENNGLHEWAHKDRETIAGYRKTFAELRAENDNLRVTLEPFADIWRKWLVERVQPTCRFTNVNIFAVAYLGDTDNKFKKAAEVLGKHP